MNKVLVNFLLTLSLLFWSSGAASFAATSSSSGNDKPHADIAASDGSSNADCFGQRLPETVRLFSKATKKEKTIITSDNEEDEEDDESDDSKKPLASYKYLRSFDSAHTPRHFTRLIKERASFCKHFAYYSSFTYIVFRVIRI